MAGRYDEIIGILVIYNTNLEDSQTFQSLFSSLLKEGEKIDLVIFDNSTRGRQMLREDYDSCFRIHYLADPSNPGVSKAYNEGYKIARRLRKKWLLLLDQDTVFPPNALSTYFKAMESNGSVTMFAPMLVCEGRIYSPCGHIANVNYHLKKLQPGPVSTTRKSILNSGTCVKLETFEALGGFDENIPLDFADHDFIKRYRKHFDSFVLVDLVCTHGFSDKDVTDGKSALVRFGYYCKGARNSIKSLTDAATLFGVAFVRALSLAVRFRDSSFVHLFLKAFIQKQIG